MTANEETNEEQKTNGEAEQDGDINAEAPVEGAPAEETAPEEAPAEEAPAAQAEEPAPEAPAPEEPEAAVPPAAKPAAPAPAAADEGEEPLSAKQRRKLERSRSTAPPAPQRSPSERLSERADLRRAKAAHRRRWRVRRRERDRSKPAQPAREAPAAEERAKGARKQRQGVVVSSKADKSITVRIDLVRSHRVYGKVIHETNTLHAHDEQNQAGEGDVVRVVECRPLSRFKRWRLVEVVEKAR